MIDPKGSLRYQLLHLARWLGKTERESAGKTFGVSTLRVIELLGRVCTVSVETIPYRAHVKIIRKMP